MNLFRLCGDVLYHREKCASPQRRRRGTVRAGVARRLDRRPRPAPERDEKRRRHLAQDAGALFDRLRGALRRPI